jgi:hypothetical protein
VKVWGSTEQIIPLMLSHSIKRFSIFYWTWKFIIVKTQILWDINTVSLVNSSLRWLNPSIYRELCTQWYSRIPQKTLIFIVRTM